jgi:hypothetical protein
LSANDFRSSRSRTMIVVPVTLSISLKPETIKQPTGVRRARRMTFSLRR